MISQWNLDRTTTTMWFQPQPNDFKLERKRKRAWWERQTSKHRLQLQCTNQLCDTKSQLIAIKASTTVFTYMIEMVFQSCYLKYDMYYTRNRRIPKLFLIEYWQNAKYRPTKYSVDTHKMAIIPVTRAKRSSIYFNSLGIEYTVVRL